VGTQERIQCPACGKSLSVSSASVGRKGKCAACNAVFVVELPSRATSSNPPPPPPKPSSQAREAEIAQQPTHREEFGQDKRRILAAVSVAPDKYALIEPYLMDYEEPVAIAVQRQFPFSLSYFHRIAC
jgi:predicted Zn finger-like uncharacterized protein